MTGWKSRFRRRLPDRRLVLHWLLGLLVAIFLTLVAGDRMRRGLFDSWQAANPRNLSATDVRVVLIDDRSVEAVGPWQWPRYYMARLTEELAARQAKVIAFDILFPEHDRVRPDTFVGLYPELSPGAASEVKALKPMDELFGQVVGASPVVLAHAGVAAAPAGQAPLADAPVSGKLPPKVDSWPAELAAIPELDDVALGTGVVNARPDVDGVIREMPLVVKAGGKPRLGFATEIALNMLGAEKVEVSEREIRIGDKRIPIDRRGRLRLHFGSFPPDHIISAADVLGQSTRISKDEFAGKAVLVGVSAEGTSDITATPLAAEEFGPLVQAQAVDALLRGGWLVRPAWARWAEWGVAGLLALLALASAKYGRRFQLFLGAAFLSVPVATWLLSFSGLQLDPARPLIVGGGALAGVAIGLFARARNERERLREALIHERIAAAAAESELEVARAIQLGMVPPRSRLKSLDPRVDVDALLEPAKSVGGDFYDAVRIGDHQVGFLTADVAGKGVPAALFMAMSKALTSAALSRLALDPADLAEAINSELLKDNREAMAVAMLIGVLDLETGVVSLVCAGHEDPLLLPARGSGLERVRLDGGPPFGVTEFPYPLESVTLRPGDVLVLVTDGVTEAQDPKGRLFGRDRILTNRKAKPLGAEAICEAIRDQVRRFEGGDDPTDDLTVMAVRLL